MKKISLGKILSLSLAINLSALSAFMILEPELTKGASDTDDITVTQSVTSEVSISAPANVTMSASIPGITGNLGAPRTGSATWTVITNNSGGFILALKAGTDPAMQLNGSNQFTDYSPAVAGIPDYDWTSPAASAAEFGYTVEPATEADTITKFKDNGADTCGGAGAVNTADKCWYDFTTVDENVINRGSNTASGGEAEVVKFRTESNAKYLASGSYVATITATATEN